MGKKRGKLGKAGYANLLAGFFIRQRAFEKAGMVKSDPAAVAKFAASFGVVSVLALGLWVYFDPEVNLIPAPLNYFLFVFMVLVLVYIQLFFK